MNDPHKFGTECGSDNAPERSAAIVSHHDSIKWFEAILPHNRPPTRATAISAMGNETALAVERCAQACAGVER
jgi:hypothetical protein